MPTKPMNANVAELQAEIARLDAEVTELRMQIGQTKLQAIEAATTHRDQLIGSQAETAQARRDHRETKRVALDAEVRHRSEITTSAGHLASAETLLAELRASEAARQAAEHQQQILNQELSHRLKNTLTMVQAIAMQTLRGSADQPAVRAFSARLIALSTAHDVLMRQNWTPAPIHEVADKVLAIHAGPETLTISGPDLRLSSRAALSLSLLLHELATNAIKYGAWSCKGGTVDLSWSSVPSQRHLPADLLMVWQERGGPPVQKPTRTSFGSRLIGAGLGTGKTTLHWDESGLRGEFQAPLAQLIEVSTTEQVRG